MRISFHIYKGKLIIKAQIHRNESTFDVKKYLYGNDIKDSNPKLHTDPVLVVVKN